MIRMLCSENSASLSNSACQNLKQDSPLQIARYEHSSPHPFTSRSCSRPRASKMSEIVPVTMALPSGSSPVDVSALAASYEQKIRPLLDVVDHLRHLNVMQEGIELPTIVVVGDQSSGKSSVLESLAGISLPRGQGICTRVPLIMRLQNYPSADAAELHLEYNGKVVPTTESDVSYAISVATDVLAGESKGISDAPLTLTVKKRGVPDLTMVDLPGITRVPVRGQPDNIYEQISAIIMKYIEPKESIVLNVLSASVDFSTCESVRMSQKVDPSGERTLAVVTKPDKAPEGLLEKVTADDINIGLGYVCVRNRIGNESYGQARKEETRLFEEHPLLSKIDKSIVGVRVLASKLMEIQAASIARNLPDIVKKINDKLNRNLAELQKMPENLSSVTDAMRAFMRILSSSKESLRNLLIRGAYDEFPDEPAMHGVARVAGMFMDYSKQFPTKVPQDDGRFLIDEITVLEEAKGLGLPNFLPRSAFCTLLKGKLKLISHIPHDFVDKVWAYLEVLILRVLAQHSDNFPQMQSSVRAAAQVLVDKMKGKSYKAVNEIIDMEMTIDFTCNPDYMNNWTLLMTSRDELLSAVEDHSKSAEVEIQHFGKINIFHLRERSEMVEQAFDTKMRLTAYWKCIVLRFVDSLALHVMYTINNLVEYEIENEMVDQILGSNMSGLQKMLEEPPSVASKRQRLKTSVKLLKDSKLVVANVMDRIVAFGE